MIYLCSHRTLSQDTLCFDSLIFPVSLPLPPLDSQINLYFLTQENYLLWRVVLCLIGCLDSLDLCPPDSISSSLSSCDNKKCLKTSSNVLWEAILLLWKLIASTMFFLPTSYVYLPTVCLLQLPGDPAILRNPGALPLYSCYWVSE